ncbi:uncharacterized protein LOC134009755 [Osmerus eperlanus]|uniref:uncharacterized protein LOC134009755 n=1 Tax=Osmerus eperlanus TaxID=29151 RepID=UPI002E0ED493
MAERCGQNITDNWYQHAVFFEVKHLTNIDKERIKRYFNIRRNGGGECGEVEEVGEKTYRIAFLEKRVQERVLEIRDHVISLPGGELCVSVRDRRSPDSTDPHQPPQLPSDDQQTPSSSKELEKVFIMDQYLLQYLRDCPKANKALNKQLITLKSSVQLFPETEQAVVKWEAAGAGPVARPTLLEWVLQVEQIFNSVRNVYRPHYELDPARVKILKSNMAALNTEDVKVYLEEDDFAVVVVGRIGDVKEKLKMLEEKNQTRKDCPVSERQYHLVKEELEKELSSTRGSSPHPAPTSNTLSQAGLEVVFGSLEDQQVEALVVPMIKTQLCSTKIGKCLSRQSRKVKTSFDLAAEGRCCTPGGVLEVKLSSFLGNRKVFFVECLPWDAAQGPSEKALRTGLALVLDTCRQQGLSSVALPVIGPGIALKFPLCEAIRIVTEEILKFGSSGPSGSISTIRIVIKPGYPASDESFQNVHKSLSSKMVTSRGKVFRSLTFVLDDVTLKVGGVQVQVVFGDITNETTDVVVNTTDFVDLQSGVCKDILTMAGPEVETELRSAHVTRGGLYESKPGRFPCKSLLHVCGESNITVIQGLVSDIMKTCDQKGYQSVAIPAICAGKGGLDPELVADSILQGVKATASSTPLHHLKLVRLVLIKMDVFLAFRHSAEQPLPTETLWTWMVKLVLGSIWS